MLSVFIWGGKSNKERRRKCSPFFIVAFFFARYVTVISIHIQEPLWRFWNPDVPWYFLTLRYTVTCIILAPYTNTVSWETNSYPGLCNCCHLEHNVKVRVNPNLCTQSTKTSGQVILADRWHCKSACNLCGSCRLQRTIGSRNKSLITSLFYSFLVSYEKNTLPDLSFPFTDYINILYSCTSCRSLSIH